VTTSSDDSAQTHYERLAASYDSNWAYSQPYITWMTQCVTSRAQISRGDRVADIGCGTGLYSRGLAAAAGAVICADPSAAMLAQLPARPEFTAIQASAQDIASQRILLPHPELDVLIIKEAVHHIPEQDRQPVLAGLAGLLAPGGRLVIVMLPKQISYPLFTAALDLFEHRQPDPAAIEHILAGAGLRTRLDYESFPLSFPAQQYTSMVRARYMSLLVAFDDKQIERGITEITTAHPGDRIAFDDTFAFITGRQIS
jgi:ubiquinone/menaquinone biosynthesis C-methylase UbiE